MAPIQKRNLTIMATVMCLLFFLLGAAFGYGMDKEHTVTHEFALTTCEE